ncbi:hypothetical protein pb186bvf_012114 [Paramecium bursaria]
MELCDFFIEVSQIEKTVEMSRQYLTSMKSYHPYLAFKTIDTQEKGCITPVSVQKFLHENGFLQTLRDCHIIFYKQDLRYPDFLRLILPSEEKLRNAICSLQPSGQLTQEVIYQLAKHIDKEIRLMNTLCIPQNIQLQSGSREHIKEYFQQQTTFIYQDELDDIVRRLDFYGDGQIDLELFKQWSQQLKQMPIEIHQSPKQSVIQSDFQTPQKQLSTSPVKKVQTKVNMSSSRVASTKSTVKKRENISNPKLRVNVTSQSEKKYLTQKQELRCELALRRIAPKSILKNQKVKKSKYVDVLEYLLDWELKVEKLKQQLALQKDFNAFDAFKAIDRYYRGFIDPHDMDEFMIQKRGVSLGLFRNYPSEQMKFSDFIQLIQPFSQYHADIMQNKLPLAQQLALPLVEIFSKATIKILFEILNKVQTPPAKLNGDQKLFLQIDQLTKDNYIGVSDLQQYLYENGLRYTHQEVLLLVLKYDKDKDGRLSIEEFLQI